MRKRDPHPGDTVVCRLAGGTKLTKGRAYKIKAVHLNTPLVLVTLHGVSGSYGAHRFEAAP